jgi:alcohol dehydrogenase
MKIRAAVVREFGAPLCIEEVDLAPPATGEVLVKLEAAGVCHTDLAIAEHDSGTPLPLVLGHEGAGRIAGTGPGVSNLKEGDRVLLTGAAACGVCPRCLDDQPTVCDVYRPIRFNGTLLKGERRLSRDGQPINHFFFQSSFAEYAVVPADAAIKIREDAPPDLICYLGCGGITGLGSVLHSAQVKPGQSVAVYGCGTVGLSAVMGAQLAEATPIVAVDLLDSKLAMALTVGATDTVNAAAEDATARVKAITGGGADVNILAMDDAVAISRVIDEARVGSTCVLVGSPPQGHNIELIARSAIREKLIRGSSMGSSLASQEIPRYLDLFMEGRLPLDKLVTRRYPLEDINLAFQALKNGAVIKAVITF